jgi:hypothetical protein
MKKNVHKPVVHHKKQNPPLVIWLPLAALVFFIVAAVTWRVMSRPSVNPSSDVNGASVSVSTLQKEVDSLTVSADDTTELNSLKKGLQGL